MANIEYRFLDKNDSDDKLQCYVNIEGGITIEVSGYDEQQDKFLSFDLETIKAFRDHLSKEIESLEKTIQDAK